MREPEHEQDGLTPADRELETAMRALRPAPPALDRDRLLFDAGAAAGRARARRSVLVWRAAAAVVAVALGASWAARVGTRPGAGAVRERIVYVERPGNGAAFSGGPSEDDGELDAGQYAATAPGDRFGGTPFPYDDGYLALRGAVASRGLNAVRDVRAKFVADQVPSARPAGAPGVSSPG